MGASSGYESRLYATPMLLRTLLSALTIATLTVDRRARADAPLGPNPAPTPAAPSTAIPALPTPAAPPPVVGGSPYRIRWECDLPIAGVAAAGTMAGFIGYDPPACLPSCTPPTSMPGFDQLVVGNYNRGAHGAANAIVLTMLYAPMALDLADSRGDGFLEDAVVFYQSILVTQMFTQIVKSATSHDAPLIYNPSALQEDLESADAGRSFWSGHTATTFAAATAYSVTFWQRHPDSPWRFVVLGLAESIAVGVAALKIEAGYHYPSDVIAGGLAGAAIGVLTPMLHSAW
jgi:membrane-associated phospholipid phosphatase